MIAGLADYLNAQTDITNIVGADNVWNGVGPTTASYPRLHLHQLSGVPDHNMDGATELCGGLVQVDCLAQNVEDRHSLGEAVRIVLDTFRGDVGNGANDVFIRKVYLQDWGDTEDFTGDGSQRFVFRRRMDFELWYDIAVPTP